ATAHLPSSSASLLWRYWKPVLMNAVPKRRKAFPAACSRQSLKPPSRTSSTLSCSTKTLKPRWQKPSGCTTNSKRRKYRLPDNVRRDCHRPHFPDRLVLWLFQSHPHRASYHRQCYGGNYRSRQSVVRGLPPESF